MRSRRRRSFRHCSARLAELGLPLAVHAEAPERFRGGLLPQNPVEWNAARPSASEEAALDRLLPPPPALRLHVAHVTTAPAAARLRTAGVSFEATPHHLFLSERSGRRRARQGQPAAPFGGGARRPLDDVRRGEVPCLASDHAPHALSAKELPFAKAPSGMPGVETMVPLCLARVRSAELDLATLVAAACDRPARWLGQPLGRIAPGHRANLIVVDFKARTRLDARRLHAPCGWTAFEGEGGDLPARALPRRGAGRGGRRGTSVDRRAGSCGPSLPRASPGRLRKPTGATSRAAPRSDLPLPARR